MIVDLLRGATFICDLAIAVFFWRYWKDKGDSLFRFFACAFFLLAISALVVALLGSSGDFAPFAYGLRLIAFLSIIAGIVNKNRPAKRS